jgi:hypothetical protein
MESSVARILAGWIPGSSIGLVMVFSEGPMAFYIEKPRVLLDQTRDFIEIYAKKIRVYFNGIGTEMGENRKSLLFVIDVYFNVT